MPPMPWLSKSVPSTPRVTATGNHVSWAPVSGASKYAVQARYGKTWRCISIVSGGATSATVPNGADAIAVTAVDRFSSASSPGVVGKR